MAFVSPRKMLSDAQLGGYAVGAFNAENLEMAQAIVAAAEEMRAPVIVQTTPGTLQYAQPGLFAAIVGRLARAASVPVALHLDHGDSFELARDCAREGYTSLMIDGSRLPFEQNVQLTRRVVALSGDMCVEAELGTVGGKEDGMEAKTLYTEPAQATAFVELTGIAALAVAIGTAHGIYHGVPRLDIERLKDIRRVVSVPLVLHGTSGVPHEQVRACIEAGICKVNYATELRMAFTEGVKRYIGEKPQAYDPKGYLASGRDNVKQRVCRLIRLCGSDGRARE